MNIFEIAEKFNLKTAKLKRMQKAGLLICDEGDGHPLAPAMRANLAKRQPLSVEQLFVLIEKPSVIAELKLRQSDAKAQIAALGEYKANEPPHQIIHCFVDAASNDEKCLLRLIHWIKGILPDHPVNHAWIAVRVSQNIDVSQRTEFQIIVRRALYHCRRHETFAGWFGVETLGSCNFTTYFRPEREKMLAKYDL